MGIWAALFWLAHVVIGLQVHAARAHVDLLRYPAEQARLFPLRLDSVGWANHLGLLLVLLLVLSNDWSLRRLGAQRWKGLQRWNYAVFGLVLAHGVLYQVLEKRIAGWVITFAVLSVLVIVLQVAGFRGRHKQKQASATQ